MRHNVKKGLKLGTDASHTKAMKKSLAKALFENDRIKTTETRAKALRSVVEPIITWAKKGDLHSRRLAIAALAGVILNAILPGNDYKFGVDPQGDKSADLGSY